MKLTPGYLNIFKTIKQPPQPRQHIFKCERVVDGLFLQSFTSGPISNA